MFRLRVRIKSGSGSDSDLIGSLNPDSIGSLTPDLKQWKKNTPYLILVFELFTHSLWIKIRSTEKKNTAYLNQVLQLFVKFQYRGSWVTKNNKNFISFFDCQDISCFFGNEKRIMRGIFWWFRTLLVLILYITKNRIRHLSMGCIQKSGDIDSL